VLFGTDVGGSNTNCTVDINLSVDRVVMDSTYTATLTINSGQRLSMDNFLAQYGTLDLVGTAAVQAGDYVNLHGTVASLHGMGGGPATLSAAGSFFITGATIITATTQGSGGGTLTLSGGSFDDSGTINVGSATSPSSLTASGNFVENSDGTITVFGGSTLTFQTGGSSSATADIKGALKLAGSGVGNATVSNAQALWVDGGTLTVTGGFTAGAGNVITGDVGVFNTGTVTVGTSTTASTLSLTGGSLTVGASAPGLSNTGGTLTLNSGASLKFPAAAGVTSTFVVQGGPSSAVVNMNGATITMDTVRVASLDLESGVLSSNSTGDTITGNLTNNGTVEFTGALHTLTVSGSYTQDLDGTLEIRLNNGAASDKLAIGGSATLDGTLDRIPQDSLTADQTWTVMTYAAHTGDFSTVNFPNDGNPAWSKTTGGTTVDVDN
jgi:hypothetical protein